MKILIVCACLLVSVYGQSCKSPCHPWVADDKCTRKTGKIDVRWGVSLPTRIQKDGVNVTYLSYGFCASVDELQSFQLNYSAVSVALNKSVNGTGGATYQYLETESYVWMWGAGGQNDPQFPGVANDSATLVYDGAAPLCDDGPAIVSMLVYNVTLTNGRYNYQDGQAVGVGFQPTCGPDNYCKMDPSMKCIGRDGSMNCAYCLNKRDPLDIVGKDVVIFTTYYGTDSRGKTLLSGSSNPLNFRAFAGGGAYSDMSKNMANLEDAGDKANPLKDVDSYDWDGLSKARLSTGVPNANIDGL